MTDCDGAGLNTRALQLFKDEVDLQRKLSFHPNIVRFIGACCQIPRRLIAEPTAEQRHPRLQVCFPRPISKKCQMWVGPKIVLQATDLFTCACCKQQS